MPDTGFGRIDPQVATDFVEATLEATARAEAASPPTVRRLRIGAVAVELAFADPDLAELGTRAVRHLLTDDPADETVRIHVWDTASTGVALPPPRWAWHGNRYEADGLVTTYDRVGRRFTLADVARGEAVYWMSSSTQYPAWEEPAPFRDLFDRLLAPRGYTFVHAASVGDGERTLLLAGPSGSGKSTTVATAVAAGFATLGDDYVVLDPDRQRCHSLYLTTRLLRSSPAPVDHDGIHAGHDDKSVLLLDEMAPDRLRRTMELAAVVVPRVGGGAETRTRAIRPFEALQALAPSSLVQLDPRQSGLAAMAALVRETPVHGLDLGHDLDGVVAAVGRLLSLGAVLEPT